MAGRQCDQGGEWRAGFRNEAGSCVAGGERGPDAGCGCVWAELSPDCFSVVSTKEARSERTCKWGKRRDLAGWVGWRGSLGCFRSSFNVKDGGRGRE